LRVVFFGSTRLSCRVLSILLESSHEVVGVVTQPDQPAGRNMMLTPTAVCSEAENLDLPIFKPEKITNNRELRRGLRGLKPEAYLTASYGKIISRKALELVEFPLNVHPSMLPKLRGASPARTALLQGLSETGCCIMRMTPRMDDGDVLLRRPLPIGPGWNFYDLLGEMGQVGGEMAVEALDLVVRGAAQFAPQDHSQATYCGIHTRDDTIIDWSRSVPELLNFIRAWDPDVGACTMLPDGRRLKIWSAAAGEPEQWRSAAAASGPGTVLGSDKRHFWVATGEGGALRIDEVQPENKQRMAVANFLAGNSVPKGTELGAPVAR
jgi:methionyl-tRNA formyltransferase